MSDPVRGHDYFEEKVISRLYAAGDGLLFRLHGAAIGSDYLFVSKDDHPNYDTLVGVVMLAAANQHKVTVRLRPESEWRRDQNRRHVSYVVMDWDS